MENNETLLPLAQAARRAASRAASLSTKAKNEALDAMAHEIELRRDWLKEENRRDMQEAEQQACRLRCVTGSVCPTHQSMP